MIDWLTVNDLGSGIQNAYDFGFTLGEKGKKSVKTDLIKSDLWLAVTSKTHASVVKTMLQNTKQQFPEIYKELQGLADGLALPFEQVFAWNCRGDLITNSSDGCTTVQRPGNKIIIAHNEDGLPFFDGECFIVERAGEAGFTSFCYPASIPGHSFAMTNSGIVMTTNNLRYTNFEAQIPRMVLTRQLLNCTTIDNARELLSKAMCSGGFHFSLAQIGDPRLISLEFGAGHYADTEIDKPSIHTNHALIKSNSKLTQVITQSSEDRQQRGTEIVNDEELRPIDILRDKTSGKLPIWRREVDDPDEENTLASVVFEVSEDRIDWSIYAGDSKQLVYSNKQ